MRASILCVTALLLMVVGMAANAQPTYQAYITWPSGYNLTVNTRNNVASGFLSEGSSAVPFLANFTKSANPGGAPSPYAWDNPFSVYCIDINHGQYNNVFDAVTAPQSVPGGFTTDPAVSANEVSEAAWLIDKYGNLNLGANSALQVAIWSVVSGNSISTSGNDVTNGVGQYFYVSGYDPTLSNDADFMLTTLATATDNGTNLAGISGADNGYVFNVAEPANGVRGVNSGQNLLGGWDGAPIDGGSGEMMTPEGSSLYMFVLGLAPLLGAFWLKRRRLSGVHSTT